MFKKEVRIVAWDDCAFSFGQKKVVLVGAVFRGAAFMDGLLSTSIEKDGDDATEKIADAVLTSNHYDQLSLIMLDGITFAGFNTVDISELNRKTGLPVIAVQKEKVNTEEFMIALRKMKNADWKGKAAKAAGQLHVFGDITYQTAGLTEKEAQEIMKITCVRSKIPEPLRVAHLIASGLKEDEKE